MQGTSLQVAGLGAMELWSLCWWREIGHNDAFWALRSPFLKTSSCLSCFEDGLLRFQGSPSAPCGDP